MDAFNDHFGLLILDIGLLTLAPARSAGVAVHRLQSKRTVQSETRICLFTSGRLN
jgi:hypothetical protein